MQRLRIADNSAVCSQAQFQAIETRARQVQETLTQQEAEAVKLEQRLAAAREQYDSGLSKLRSTARQLESLASQARQNPASASVARRLVTKRIYKHSDVLGRGVKVGTCKPAGYELGMECGGDREMHGADCKPAQSTQQW